MKFVLNKCYGGFVLSEKAEDELKAKLKLKGELNEEFFDFEIERNNETLVEVVEKFGSEAYDNSLSKLRIVDIPDENTDYEIDECDGFETITYVLDGKLHYA